jgi:hypothetical protein
MDKKDRTVYLHEDGVWVNQRNDRERASSLHTTQKAAEKAAGKMLMNQGGGELIIKDVDGRIRNKETIGNGTDLYPPKDKKN